MGASPIILGIGGSDHDVHACVVRNGKVEIAIEEERLSRKKYGLGGNLMEGLGRNYVMQRTGLELDQFDHVVVDAILPKTASLAVRKRARSIDHHLCHAAATWFTADFDSAAILVVDNAGGMIQCNGQSFLQAATWFQARGRDIRKLGQVGSTNWKEGPALSGTPYQRGDGDHSLGHLYKKVTGALGFRFPRDADADGFFFPEDGITMGLAAFAEPRYVDRLWELVELLPAGQFRLWLNDGRFDAILAELLASGPDDFEARAAVAASAQEVLHRVLCHVVDHLLASTGETRLCMAGGVAMNSVANAEILRRTAAERIHIPPVPGDNGTGIGAALWMATRDPDAPVPAYTVYAGGRYSNAEIDATLQTLDPDRFRIHRLQEDALIEETAQLLARGNVVAWFAGGSENGRRALGNRSLLAAPHSAAMREHINSQVKHRQWFRPFAPVVPEQDAATYFELTQRSPYMQIVFAVRPQWRAELAAITHVDGTARVQTVNADQNPRLLKLLRAYQRLAGIPVLLNTSFNGPGEPIVETPQQAVDCLLRMPFEGLILEDRLVVRR